MPRGSGSSGLFVLMAIGAIVWAFWTIVSKISAMLNIKSEKIAAMKFESRQRELMLSVESSKNAALKEIATAQQLLQMKEEYLNSLRAAFGEGYIGGRQWLARFVAEADKANDEILANYFNTKSHPAPKTAQVVSEVKREKREAIQRLKYLEYQLVTYREYFPFLEEFEDVILDDRVYSETGESVDLSTVDKVSVYVSREEYLNLSVTERNQLALDNYIKKRKSKWEIGRLYERYIGHLYEREGWNVVYHGAVKGFEDLGRDLVCCKDGMYEIVQAKCWSKDKKIREKHVFQTFGTSLAFEIENKLSPRMVQSVLISTTNYSDVAVEAANRLNVQLRVVDLSLDYPMIKCNINQEEKIYHLPFDQQYDRVKLCNPGERYVKSVLEAERAGFRRARRHHAG